MRHDLEDPGSVLDETAYRAESAGALAGVPRTRLLWCLAISALCVLVAPAIGLSTNDVDPRIAEIWPVGGAGFVLLAVLWHFGTRFVVSGVVYVGTAFAVTAVLLGQPPSLSVWWGITTAAQPLLMALAYRSRTKHLGWAPETPGDLAALLFAALSSSAVVGLAGGFPFVDPSDIWSPVLGWWVLRNTVFCFVAAATFLVMFLREKDTVLPQSRARNWVPLVLASVACVYAAYDHDLPLNWLILVPSVWGGLTLTMRGAAYLSLAVALMAGAMTYQPHHPYGYGAPLPSSSIVDLLVTAMAASTLLLVLMRLQRGSLIHELDRQGAQSEERRQLLETVLESMGDGVIIADREGIRFYNAAARTLVGRPIPRRTPRSWVQTFALTAPDGTPLQETDVRSALFGPEGEPRSAGFELKVGSGRDARVVELSARPLPGTTDGSLVLLLHDATRERARLRELSNFAGAVAHDLRGPLTVLEGWLEVLADDPTEGERADALGRSREASRRLRQVVEDWLSYAVVQNGQLSPVEVDLGWLVGEVVDGHRAGILGDEEPEFVLDVGHAVRADLGMLRQVLDNLVGNAVKYTPVGVRPRVRLTSRRDVEPGWIRLEVTDQGIGVPEGEEELIFEEFHRGSQAGRSPGTGLGLALTRRIVGRHGGQLSARRNPGGGSTFALTLPEA